MDPRLRSALSSYAFGVIGVFLVFAPWSALYGYVLVWSDVASPTGAVLASGWFRGALTGVGLLDVVVAVREARRLRSPSVRPTAGDPV